MPALCHSSSRCTALRLAGRTAAPKHCIRGSRPRTITRAIQTTEEKAKQAAARAGSDPATTTEKYGLEAGLFKVFTNKDEGGQSRTEQAKALLAKYGSAYLITSISFAIVSFSACYALVSAGVDVVGVLDQVGLHLEQGSTGETVGTVAIAYAAHKALSPVRFPPTVALTPVVAQWLGKRKGGDAGGSSEDGSK